MTASNGRSASDLDYEAWLARRGTSGHRLALQHKHALRLGPVIDVLVVLDATDRWAGDRGLHRSECTISSLLAQSWSHWRCIVIGDRAPRSQDGRIVSRRGGVGDFAALANEALATSTAHAVVFLRSGDQLQPSALYSAALAMYRDPTVELVYWDDDLGPPDEVRREPRFKPSWSPEYLLSHNYIDRSVMMSRDRIRLAGGIGGPLDGPAMWDLLLRIASTVDLEPQRVARLPEVLGTLVGRRSLDCGGEERMLLQKHIARLDPAAQLRTVRGRPRVVWPDAVDPPSVTIVMPTRHNRQLVRRSLGSLSRTQYGGSVEVIVVDNGDWGDDPDDWYATTFPDLRIRVLRWEGAFNYSAVNNRGAEAGAGDVLVFLNDDTEILSAGWLKELVGWLQRPGVGLAGLQLLDETGAIQHAGAFLGLGGFADHLFQGLRPDNDTIFGPVASYRNVLAVTGACLAIQREVFCSIGGFDERFVLCGSDVVLGLDVQRMGLRAVVSPHERVAHLESRTRGTSVPAEDFFASFWRYQPFLFGGDPYLSPNLSLQSRVPRLRGPDEPDAREMLREPLGRAFGVFRQRSEAAEAYGLADLCRATADDTRSVVGAHRRVEGRRTVRDVTWFLPEMDSPFYGGVNTALRIADQLAREHDVANRFVVWSSGPEQFVRSALIAAFPSLERAEIVLFRGDPDQLDLQATDAAIATLWVTAYMVARLDQAVRRFYLIQDFEPSFYPAGTLYALSEQTYRLGLYGLCNTAHLLDMYRGEYGGKGMSFQPAVDRQIFNPRGRPGLDPGRPVTVFVYARPGHWRNCWELASLALREVKRRLGRRVRIVTAGSWANEDDMEESAAMRHLGLLDYRATGPLYRSCDVGIALTVSRHPSYLPLELMASGVGVVAFDNPHGHWLLRNGENCLLAPQTVDGLADAVERLVVDAGLRTRIAEAGLETVARHHSDWPGALGGIYDYLCDPEPPSAVLS